MTGMSRDAGTTWRALDPHESPNLVDARLQVHHAAQLVSALGISYLVHEPDDSHTNLEWLDALGALAGRPIMGSSLIRGAVRFHPLALLTLDDHNAPRATMPLHGVTITGAAEWMRARLAECDLDPAAYTLDKHYTIPSHRVAGAGAFDDSAAAAFENLSRFYSDASLALEQIAGATPNAAPVRCWPHHFDIATLLEVTDESGAAARKTISLGMTPGDAYYHEPYFYASMYPSPSTDGVRPPLEGRGDWHSLDWLGAVLPGSRLVASTQQTQVDAFLSSAVAACTSLLVRAG
ncbi:MAG: hypothetical protein ABJF01_00295 [bacterium]